jgi:hypothetical protein
LQYSRCGGDCGRGVIGYFETRRCNGAIRQGDREGMRRLPHRRKRWWTPYAIRGKIQGKWEQTAEMITIAPKPSDPTA